MITIEEARNRIGVGVVYQPYPDAPREDGTITSVTETAHRAWVFVLYTGDRNPKATRPEDLSWLAPVPQCAICGRERDIRDAYDAHPT